MTTQVSFLAAFIAGILSITSPCVLPLVPLYLAHLANVSTSGGVAITRRGPVYRNALAYVFGFSLVFIALGIAVGSASSLVSAAGMFAEHRYWFVRFGGVFLALLGLNQIGVIAIPFLQRDYRVDVTNGENGNLTSSFLVGVTFGAGWTPCVGPILGAILTLAASQGDVTRAAALLATYSLGLAIPFLIMAIFGARSGMLKSLSQRAESLASVSGALMLAVGVLMILGLYQQVFARLVAAAPWSPWEPNI